MEAKQTTYGNLVNYRTRRINMLNDVTVNSMNDKDEVIPVTLKKGRKYKIDDCCRMDSDGLSLMLCTVTDVVFGYRYECILECSEVIDLFLFAEMSQC